MEILQWLVSILLVALLIYSFFKPYLQGIDHSKLRQPDFSIQEEEVLEKPAPKKRRPYKKRKPKNATTEKKDL